MAPILTLILFLLLVLPRQDPVDRWVLQERMVRLKNFVPTRVKRVQIMSLRFELFSPAHDTQVRIALPFPYSEISNMRVSERPEVLT